MGGMMSRKIESKMTGHEAVEFWGGDDNGVCLQVQTSTPLVVRGSTKEQIQEPGFIQLTMEEGAELCNVLSAFVKDEAIRRQSLLREKLKCMQEVQRTVFNEVACLPSELFAGQKMAITMVSRFCPKGS